MTPDRKTVIVILDGLGDVPHAAFEGQTPLEAAATPNLDRLVSEGSCGLVDPLRPGVPVDTQTGTGVLLGLAADDIASLSRGPVDAAGMGLTLAHGDVALRCNFATLSREDGALRILDRRAGRITRGTGKLAKAINQITLPHGIKAKLVPGVQHRGALRLSGPGLSPDVSDTDPGTRSPDRVLPSHARRANDAGGVRTAEALNVLLEQAAETLDDHPVNQERRAQGLPPANGILTRGAGAGRRIRNLLLHLRLRAAVVAGDRTILGLASLSGFTRVTDPAFTCLADTDIKAKARAALDALADHDVVYLHVKATDVLSHDQDPDGKRAFLERVDTDLAPLFAREDIVIGVAADHSTSSITGRHTGDPVPALVCSPTGRRDLCTRFNETMSIGGGLGRISAPSFLRTVLDAAGAVSAYTPADRKVYLA